jgi:hypothetical protein
MGGSLPSRWGGRLFSSFRYDSKDRACSQHEWGRQGAPFIYSSGGGTERAAFSEGASVVLSDVYRPLLLSPPIQGGARRTGGLSAGTMHLVPLIPARLSSEDVRCSDRDRGGHDSGISSCS